jgi:hypothetical protein
MKRAILWTWLTLGVAACAATPTADILSFTESGPDGEQPVRMLVSDRYLRIDDGSGRDGYILFDRGARTVYSVSHPGKTTMVLPARAVTLAAPARFVHTSERIPESLPAVDGRPVSHYRLQTNGERCFEVYAVEGLLPRALAVLREYHEALAGEQALAQAHIPAAYQSACDLADLVFQPARHLAYGFPVRQVNHQGVTRQLLNYKSGAPLDRGVFALPEDYRQIRPSEIGK